MRKIELLNYPNYRSKNAFSNLIFVAFASLFCLKITELLNYPKIIGS